MPFAARRRARGRGGRPRTVRARGRAAGRETARLGCRSLTPQR